MVRQRANQSGELHTLVACAKCGLGYPICDMCQEIRACQSMLCSRRDRPEYAEGTNCFWKTRLVPLAAKLGVEPGLVLIAPARREWY